MDGVAQNYFLGECLFDDRRLDHRLCHTFNCMTERPDQTLPGKLTSKAALAGGYRLLNHTNVSHGKILKAHAASCVHSLRPSGGVILLLHDTPVLD